MEANRAYCNDVRFDKVIFVQDDVDHELRGPQYFLEYPPEAPFAVQNTAIACHDDELVGCGLANEVAEILDEDVGCDVHHQRVRVAPESVHQQVVQATEDDVKPQPSRRGALEHLISSTLR